MLGTSPGSGSPSHVAAACLVILIACTGLPPAAGGELFDTNFDEFPVGADQWAGVPATLPPCNAPFCGPDPWNWCANNAGRMVHGIDPDQLNGLGQTAYLGPDTPCTTDVLVYRRFDHDPFTEGTARIQVDTQIAIAPSRNGYDDSFFISFFNIANEYLGGLRFVNEPGPYYGIWRLDGVNEFQTVSQHVPGSPGVIFIDIDMENNRWSAFYLGTTIFANRTFTSTGYDLDLGSVAFEWQIHDPMAANHGDNWMQIADFCVFAVPVGEPTPTVESVTLDPNGYPVLTFTGEPGWDYQIQYSNSLVGIWRTDLPGSFFTGIDPKQTLTYTDTTTRQPAGRYYRIERTATP
ncbi:MAG: hypothetical protein HKN82_06175 [Akkermansiaceae bacterium]|nr:hypothetical protein [Akkermansiaceae bacterium]